jgi:hypothetical protein
MLTREGIVRLLSDAGVDVVAQGRERNGIVSAAFRQVQTAVSLLVPLLDAPAHPGWCTSEQRGSSYAPRSEGGRGR